MLETINIFCFVFKNTMGPLYAISYLESNSQMNTTALWCVLNKYKSTDVCIHGRAIAILLEQSSYHGHNSTGFLFASGQDPNSTRSTISEVG
jgi:hypothetical protein